MEDKSAAKQEENDGGAYGEEHHAMDADPSSTHAARQVRTYAGCFLIFCFTGILAAFILAVMSPKHDAPMRPSCHNIVRHFGTCLTMYAWEHKGEWPRLDDEPPWLLFDLKIMYPEYFSDLSLLLCSSDTRTLDLEKQYRALEDDVDENLMWYREHSGYSYLGYMVTNEREGLALLDAIEDSIRSGRPFEDALRVPDGRGTAGGDTLYALKDGVELLAATDPKSPEAGKAIQAQVPVMFDRYDGRFNHAPEGANVLFMDGHVEFRRFGEFPITGAILKKLREVELLRKGSQP